MDNCLSWSYTPCPNCMRRGMVEVFPRDYKIYLESSGHDQHFCTAQLCTSHGVMELSPVSHNVDFARFESDTQQVCRLGTFFDHLRTPRAHAPQFVTPFMARINFLTLRSSERKRD